MSSAGHVYDMIRRDKENRETRKRITKGRKADLAKCTLGQHKIDYSNVSLSEMEEIVKMTDEKSKNDSYMMNKITIIFLFAGIILIGFTIYILRKTGIL